MADYNNGNRCIYKLKHKYKMREEEYTEYNSDSINDYELLMPDKSDYQNNKLETNFITNIFPFELIEETKDYIKLNFLNKLEKFPLLKNLILANLLLYCSILFLLFKFK